MEFDIPNSWPMSHDIWLTLNEVTTPDTHVECDEYKRASLRFLESLRPKNLRSNVSLVQYKLQLTKFIDSHSYRELSTSTGGNETIYIMRRELKTVADDVVSSGKEAIMLAEAYLADLSAGLLTQPWEATGSETDS
jgi:hypothetical protein